MEDFQLKIRISPSDTEFRKILGIETFDRLKRDIMARDKSTCRGCGFRPLDSDRASAALSLHVIELNTEKPEESSCIILCKACHSTQHVDVAIEKGWVQLVNSIFSQKSLIEMGRVNGIYTHTKEEDTRFLKGNSKEILERNKYHLGLKTCKLKVVFTQAFEWGDL